MVVTSAAEPERVTPFVALSVMEPDPVEIPAFAVILLAAPVAVRLIVPVPVAVTPMDILIEPAAVSVIEPPEAEFVIGEIVTPEVSVMLIFPLVEFVTMRFVTSVVNVFAAPTPLVAIICKVPAVTFVVEALLPTIAPPLRMMAPLEVSAPEVAKVISKLVLHERVMFVTLLALTAASTVIAPVPDEPRVSVPVVNTWSSVASVKFNPVVPVPTVMEVKLVKGSRVTPPFPVTVPVRTISSASRPIKPVLAVKLLTLTVSVPAVVITIDPPPELEPLTVRPDPLGL